VRHSTPLVTANLGPEGNLLAQNGSCRAREHHTPPVTCTT
jgi:hypothetical protein